MDNRLIYIDIDDVISDTTVIFPSLLKQHFGKTVPFEAIRSFDLGESFGLDEDDLAHFLNIVHSPEVMAEYKPRAGAIESIHSLIFLGYEIAVVTGRPHCTKLLTQEWLEKHSIPFHHLLFVDKYSRTVSGMDDSNTMSLEAFSKMEFFFAVEDSAFMANYLSRNMQTPVALLDRPWNRTTPYLNNASSALVNRCLDWDEVMKRFFQGKSAVPINQV